MGKIFKFETLAKNISNTGMSVQADGDYSSRFEKLDTLKKVEFKDYLKSVDLRQPKKKLYLKENKKMYDGAKLVGK